jgi:hypothetical protein
VESSVVLRVVSPVSVVNSRVRGADGSIKTRTPAELLGRGPRPGASAPGTCHGEIREPTKWATAESIGSRFEFQHRFIIGSVRSAARSAGWEFVFGCLTWGSRPRLYAIACSAG